MSAATLPPRFAIGEKYLSAGKYPRLFTVADVLRTYNEADELVRIRYVAYHTALGQPIYDYDVCDTTIARGIARLNGNPA